MAFGKPKLTWAERQANKIAKTKVKTEVAAAKTAHKMAKKQFAESARKASIANRQAWAESANPIKRFFGRKAELGKKRFEAKKRRIEAETQVAELSPELAAQKAKTDSKVKIAKAKGHATIAATAAIAKGAASLGQGLSDERNQDDQAMRIHDQNIISSIFDPDKNGTNDGGLEDGVE